MWKPGKFLLQTRTLSVLDKLWTQKRHKEHGHELSLLNGQIIKLDKKIMEKETQKQTEKNFQEKVSASFMYVMKYRLKRIDPLQYRDVNKLTKDLCTLKTFYGNKIPKHKEEEDFVELPKALGIMKQKKSMSTVTAETYSDEEPPKKKPASYDWEMPNMTYQPYAYLM